VLELRRAKGDDERRPRPPETLAASRATFDMFQKAALAALAAVTLALASTSATQAPTTELSSRDQKELGTMLAKALDPDAQDF
jgi:hypothetical protein